MIRIFLTIALILSCPMLAGAQDTATEAGDQQEKQKYEPMFQGRDPSDIYTGADYKNYIYKALKMDPQLDFGYFRALYSNTKSYAPVSGDVRKEILTLAYKIKTMPLSQERADAMDRYTELVLRHLANIDVVLTALSLSREDKKFGNPKLYLWIYRGLLNNIMRTGRGTKLTEAFYVVTMGEETALLKQIGLKVEKTQSAKEGLLYYNMHTVYDPKRQASYAIFVDITKPMKFLEEEQRKKPKPLLGRYTGDGDKILLGP